MPVLNLYSRYSMCYINTKGMQVTNCHTLFIKLKLMEGEKRNSYDEDPVFYCKRCLSLNIRQMPFMKDQDYCGECGAVEVGEADIEEWKRMYKEKYGHDYIVKKELKWPYWC